LSQVIKSAYLDAKEEGDMNRRKRGLLIVALLFLSAVIGRIGGLPIMKTEAQEQEMAGIEKLHQQDIAATLSGDPKRLAELWTDDAVRLQPGGPPEVGKALIQTNDEKMKAQHPGMKILSYAPEIKEVQIADGWAYEWGTFSGSFQDSPGGAANSLRGKLLRVLRKQSDGSWKFARVMWNPAE